MRKQAYRERYGEWALIAGGSDGIGAAFANELAKRGINLLLLARREEALAECAASIRERYDVEVRTLSADLTAADLADKVSAALAVKNQTAITVITPETR